MQVLSYGSRGPDVELLNTALIRGGYLSGEAGNVFDAPTEDAVRAFQEANRLEADGIVGALTWAALRPYLTGYTVWTITSGDTFFALAQRFNTTVSAIMTANPDKDPKNLFTGLKVTIPLGFDVVPVNIAFTYDLLTFCVEGLMARYPFIKAEIIGHSVQNKALYALSVGEGRNTVMYNASHHANEWITTPVLMRFIEQYAEIRSGGGLTQLKCIADEMYERSTIYFVPMVNPDGYATVLGRYLYSNNYRAIV